MTDERRSSRYWLVILGVFALTLAFRLALLGLEPPSHLTFSDGPYTDEGWKALASLNFVNDPDYAYSAANFLTDRVHYAAPVQGLVTYLSLRYVGIGIVSRRIVAFTLASVIFLCTALFILPRRQAICGAAFLVLASGLFTLAYFYRLGNGYDLALALMVLILFIFTHMASSRWWMAIGGALTAFLFTAVTLHTIFFVASCAAFSIYQLFICQPRDRRGLRTALIWFWAVFLLVAGLVYSTWIAPHSVLGFDDVETRLPDTVADVVRNLIDSHKFPVRLHAPFLLSLFAVGLVAEIQRRRSVEGTRVFLILWAICSLVWMAFLSYRPVRYLHFSLFPMVVLASLWIGDLVSHSGVYDTLRSRRTTLLGGVLTLGILLLAFAPRASSHQECVFVALSACDQPMFLSQIVLVILAVFATLIVLDATIWKSSQIGPLIGALILGIVGFNTIQVVNWVRTDEPFTARLEGQIEESLDPTAPILVFNGPYLYNYLLRSNSVIYSYQQGFDDDYLSAEIGTIVVPAGSEADSAIFLDRASRAGLRFELQERIEGFPKIRNASIYRLTTSDNGRLDKGVKGRPR